MSNNEKFTNQMYQEMVRRNLDYEAKDYEKERRKLIATWQAAHPECMQQPPSRAHRTLDMIDAGNKEMRGGYLINPEIWTNDIYQVTVRRWKKDPVFGSDGGMIQIGINCLDGSARHDWREFQWIKNQIAGEECEAFELYPAESRLLDPSNYYSLWAFPGIRHIKVGVHEGRRVLGVDEALSPQRAFGGQ